MTFSTVIVGAGGFLGHRLCSSAAALAATQGGSCESTAAVCRRLPIREIFGATRVIGDRRDPEVVSKLLESQPDVWIDTAVFDENDANPLIDAALTASRRGIRLPRFVITSTIGEFGPSLLAGGNISADSPTGADDPHSAGKLRAFDAFNGASGWMETVWALLPMLWGPGDHDGSGPGGRTRLLIDDILHSRPVTFEGGCDNSMPDGFVDTVAAALIHCGRMPRSGGIARMLVAGPESLTPRGFVTEAGTAAGVVPRITVLNPGSSDTSQVRRVFPGNNVTMDCSPLYGSGFKAPCDWRRGVAATVAAAVEETSCTWGCQR